MATPGSHTYHTHDEIPAIELPFSKSMAARAIVIAAVRSLTGDSPLPPLPFSDTLSEQCDDIKVIAGGVRALAAQAASPKGAPGGTENPQEGYGTVTIDCGASGTALRFLTALAAAMPGSDVRLTGTPRLCSRPVGALTGVLRSLGADITGEEKNTGEEIHAPLLIKGKRLKGDGKAVQVDCRQSSQFLSALMLASPLMRDVEFTTGDDAASKPYITLTRRMMEMECSPAVERDWSSAAFFYEYTAISGKPLILKDLTPPHLSLQGDSATAELFAALGVETTEVPQGLLISRRDKAETEVTESTGGESIQREKGEKRRRVCDISPTPDLAVPLLVAAAFCGREMEMHHTDILRLKESDRIAAITAELAKTGINLCYSPENGGTLTIKGTIKGSSHAKPGIAALPETAVKLEAHDDHRIAMAMIAAAGAVPFNAAMDHPETVAKSFPAFKRELDKLKD